MSTQSPIHSRTPAPTQDGQDRLQRRLHHKCNQCDKKHPANQDCPSCRAKNKRLQRKAVNNQQWPSIPPVVDQVLRSSGVALDQETQSFMGSRFGQDFSQVHIHHDTKAATSAAAVDALAYTVGNHVVFAENQYRPHSQEGRSLLAHELTHVVQQVGTQHNTTPSLDRLALDNGESSAAEAEAEQISQAIIADRPLPGINSASADVIHRYPGSPAGGCGLCYGAPNLVGLEAHPLIEQAFQMRYPWLQTELTFPVLTPSPGDSNGRLDLAELVSTDRINIGEIKPSNVAGLLQGDVDLFWYEDQLKTLGFHVGRLNLPPPIASIPFPTLAPPDCPQTQDMFVDPPVQGVYTYWCQPDYAELIAICDCYEGRRRRRPTEEPVEEPIELPEPYPVPLPEAPEEPIPVPVPQPEGRPVPHPSPRPRVEPRGEPVEEPGPETEPEPPGDVIPFPVPRPQPGGESEPTEEPGGEEVPIAAMVAAMLATAAYTLTRRGGRGAMPSRAAGRALAYAQAVALVAILVFYSERVEARPGTGESPLEALFRAMGEQGVPVPEELRQRIQDDPELRRILEEATLSGDVTAAQEALNRQMLQVIADNPDEFSEEDLQMLFSSSEQVSNASGGGQAHTVESLRAALEARRSGQSVTDAIRQGGQPGAGGSGERPSGEGVEGTEGERAGESTSTREQQVGEQYPGLGATGRQQLASAEPAIRALFEAMTAASGEGPRVDDTAVERFLQTVPADLRTDEAQQLIEHLQPASGQSLDEILSGLERAIQTIRSPEEGRQAETEDDVTEGGEVESEPTPPQPEAEGERATEDVFIEHMVNVIHSFSGWGNVSEDTQIIHITDERGFNHIPIPSSVDAFLFIKAGLPSGGHIRAVANIRLRVHSRRRRRGTTTASVSFLSCGEVVREDRLHTPCPMETGRRTTITILSSRGEE